MDITPYYQKGPPRSKLRGIIKFKTVRCRGPRSVRYTGKTPVGELLRREGIYSTDLTRIRQKVREGALERLADRPGAQKKTVSQAEYDALKRELEEKERALADLSVELAVLRKKKNGGSWER